MTEPERIASKSHRRHFVKQLSVGAAAVALSHPVEAKEPVDAADAALPTIQLGEHQISRLVAGWNPIGGHSHTTLNMARYMREYFTEERTVEFLQHCETSGITAWQFTCTDKALGVIRKLHELESKLKLICLHAERSHDTPIKKIADQCGPIAMVHHGGVTDALFRAGKSDQVRDYVKKVHDAGMLAGVSTHHPDNMKQMADEDWETDLFMGCFYYVTRPREQQQEQLGKVTVGEPFFDSDPAEMTAVIRQVEKPCLGFKILAAGRSCWSSYSVEKCFRFAFESIKPIDGLIVGMFPVYHDEVHDNAEYTRKYGAK